MIVAFHPAELARAADVLRSGGLVAFPTETVYGRGARADQSAAVRAIYSAKGRPAKNPCIVHAPSADAAFRLAAHVPAAARVLAERFWPGPLTLVLEARADLVAPEVTAGGPTIALRVPSHPIARALLERVGLPIAAPSANRSTAISPTSAEHVEKSLGPSVLVLDGGRTDFGIESTILDVTTSPAAVLRAGSIPAAALAEFLEIQDFSSRSDAHDASTQALRAPGTMARHYAPRVPLTLVASDALSACPADRTAFVVHSSAPVPDRAAPVVRLPGDPQGYARELYATLHHLEDAGLSAIVVEAPPPDRTWDAVRDRLRRASHAP
ncbi:MAG: L-threonylcarbamoyladenylate synthase [Polyangiaceae bacterium]